MVRRTDNRFRNIEPNQALRANEMRNIIITALKMGFEPTIQKYGGNLNPSELAAIRSITGEERTVLEGLYKKLESVGIVPIPLPKPGAGNEASFPIQLPRQGERTDVPIPTPKPGVKNEASFPIQLPRQGDKATLPIPLLKQGERASIPIPLPKPGERADIPMPLPVPGISPVKRDAETVDRIRRIIGEAIREGMEKAIFTSGRGLQENDLQVLRSVNQYELNVLGTVNQKLTSISSFPIQLP